jgi:hypothetical protein
VCHFYLPANRLIFADFHAVFLSRFFDTALNRPDFVGVVFRGVVLLIDVTPGGTHVRGRVNRIFIVRRIGKLDVAVFVFARVGIYILAPVDFRPRIVHRISPFKILFRRNKPRNFLTPACKFLLAEPLSRFLLFAPDVVFDALDARLLRAIGAAEKSLFRLDAVPDNFAAAMRADGRELVYRALETIKNMTVSRRDNFKRQIIIVAANFASRHFLQSPSIQIFL